MSKVKRTLIWGWDNYDKILALFGLVLSFIGPAWATYVSPFMARYHPLSWVIGGCFGLLTFSAAYYLFGHARNLAVIASARSRLLKASDAIDPMAIQFNAKRFRIAEIAHPISRKISNKQMHHCDIIGPDNIAFAGIGNLQGVAFHHCSFVILIDGAFAPNVAVFENCNINGGTIWDCTIFVSQDMWNHVHATVPGAKCITYQRP